MAEQQSVYRKETMERISSPEQLTGYLRVTSPGVWVLLAAVILLLSGIFAWAAVGTLETRMDAVVIIQDRQALVVSSGGEGLSAGMPLRVSGEEYEITGTEPDEYGRSVGTLTLDLPDGTYEGTVVTEQIKPISFLLGGR